MAAGVSSEILPRSTASAWRGLASYEPRASFRAWMYRIVTNTCLDMLRTRKRRVLPQDLGPSVEIVVPLTEMRRDIAWLEPYPDAWLPDVPDPEAALLLQESVRLALVRAWQVLPPRQRAALILHDVLDWTAREVAAMLETTVLAINSALQRARSSMAHADVPSPGRGALDQDKADALARFMHAWHTGDFEQFVSMLADDAIMSMPPWVYWLKGREAIAGAFLNPATWEGEPRSGRYRLVPAAMNGQPATLAYVRGHDGHYAAVCLTVLTLGPDRRVCELTVFVLPELFTAWGYPKTVDEPQARSEATLP
jgi:RNA polymerase sigma-70 factor (ECF subfamily)